MAYFHQDWNVEHETADQVIEAFLNEFASEDLKLVRQELNSLFGKGKNELALREFLLKELSCYYCYWNEWEASRGYVILLTDCLPARSPTLRSYDNIFPQNRRWQCA